MEHPDATSPAPHGPGRTLTLEFDWHDNHCTLDVDDLMFDLGPQLVALVDKHLADQRDPWRAKATKPIRDWEYDDLARHARLLDERVHGVYAAGTTHRDLAAGHPDLGPLARALTTITARQHVQCACARTAWEDFLAHFDDQLEAHAPGPCFWAFYFPNCETPVSALKGTPTLQDISELVEYVNRDGSKRTRFTWNIDEGTGTVHFEGTYADLEFYTFGPGPRLTLLNHWFNKSGGYDSEAPAREVHGLAERDVDLLNALNASSIHLEGDPNPPLDAFGQPEEGPFNWLDRAGAMHAAAPLLALDPDRKVAATALAPTWSGSISELIEMTENVFA